MIENTLYSTEPTFVTYILPTPRKFWIASKTNKSLICKCIWNLGLITQPDLTLLLLVILRTNELSTSAKPVKKLGFIFKPWLFEE